MTTDKQKLAIGIDVGLITVLSDEEFDAAMKLWNAEPPHPHASLTSPDKIKGWCPDYPYNVDAALTLCNRAADMGWNCEANNGLDFSWEVLFKKGNESHYGAGESLALAICEAYLNLIGKWEDSSSIWPDPGCVCVMQECVCPQPERALRAWSGGTYKRKMTAVQREYCLKEINNVEGHDRKIHENDSDQDLARGVLSAWTDYVRDKGLI